LTSQVPLTNLCSIEDAFPFLSFVAGSTGVGCFWSSSPEMSTTKTWNPSLNGLRSLEMPRNSNKRIGLIGSFSSLLFFSSSLLFSFYSILLSLFIQQKLNVIDQERRVKSICISFEWNSSFIDENFLKIPGNICTSRRGPINQ